MIWLDYFLLIVVSIAFFLFSSRTKRVEAELREEIEKLNILYRHINLHKKS